MIFPKEAVILAGGQGTRLRSMINHCPKVLAEICGRPFITYIMDQLADMGFSRVILCIGYLSEMMAVVLGSSYRSMELCYSSELYPLGTGGALRLSLSLSQIDPIIVMNGDSFCDLDLKAMFATHYKRHAQASMAVISVADVSRYGAVTIDHHGNITHFEEKGQRSGSGYINAGIYMINQRVIMEIPAEQNVSLEKTIFPKLVNYGLYGFVTQGKFIDIGVPADYCRAQTFFETNSQ